MVIQCDESEKISEPKKLFRMVIPSFPAFNIYSTVAKKTTALGPVIIATVVNRMEGWEVEIIDENNYHRSGPTKDGKPDHGILQQIRQADVVGFYGGLTSTIPRLYELAGFYRRLGVVTLAGGQHFCDENIREGLEHNLDYLVMGEGEITIKKLLKNLFPQPSPDIENIPGIAFLNRGEIIKNPHLEPFSDWNRLPLPDFSLLHHAKVVIYPISWTRGCGMNCEFCTVKGKTRCPPENYVFSQITNLFETLNAKSFFIVDDLFGQYRKKTLELCRRLTEYQELMEVRFWITVQIRLDKATDTELLNAMRRAGVRIVAIGYETPIPQELEAMNKKLDPDKMIDLTRMYHKAGLLVHGMFIFAYPAKEGQQYSNISVEEHVRLFWKFIKKARLDTIQILLPVPLPGTELTARLKKAGRIFPNKNIGWEYYDGNFPLFVPDPPFTPISMHEASKQLMNRFYRFGFIFSICANILFFPMIVFSLFDLKVGWRKWYHAWRNHIWRFIGWTIIKKWSSQFNKGSFIEKLHIAEKKLIE